MTWMKLWVPPVLPRDMFAMNADAIVSPCEAIAVELEDPAPIVEHLHALKRQCAEENVQVEGVVLSSRAYFSLQQWLRTRAWYHAPKGVAWMEFDGMRVFMDPLRDDGEPVPLFEEDEAVKLYAMRKRPASPDGSEASFANRKSPGDT